MSQAIKQAAPVRTRYEDDLFTWVEEQVALLRAGRIADIDVDNIAEELRSVGASERSRLDSILRVLVMHMLKWDQQPEFRTPSWVYSISEQRRRYERLMRRNPGLKPSRDEALADIFPIARNWAAAETHFDPGEFPETCPYSWYDLLERPFEVDAWARERK
jgi:hypothetical protein